MLLRGIIRKHNFTILLFLPSPNESGRYMVPHGWVEESLNARRSHPSHSLKYFMCNSNIVKTLKSINSQEISSSMRITNTEWLAMTTVITSGSITLGVSSTFSWFQNHMTSLSSFCLWIAYGDLNDLRGGSPFFLEDSILTESKTNVGDDLDVGGAMAFFTFGLEVIFFAREKSLLWFINLDQKKYETSPLPLKHSLRCL